MDFLFDNPLSNMYGPYFLVFYILFIISTIVVYKILKKQLDRTGNFAVPPIPLKPDAFEIAFLRGGANELTRAVVFSLAQKELLKFDGDGKRSQIHLTGNKYERRSLLPIEQAALDWFGTTRETRDLFQKDGLAERLKPFYETFQARLEMQHFFPDEEMKRRNNRLKIQAFLAFGALGFYKLLAAILNGYSNVLGIIIVSLIGMYFLGLAAKMPRLTKLGDAYLKRLQIAFERIKPSNHNAITDSQAATFAAVDPFLLSVGVFGGAALAGTVYSDYNRAFERAQKQSAASSGSCGSGCGSSCSSSDGGGGSSCSSGSSCGGGCGGCGGGCS